MNRLPYTNVDFFDILDSEDKAYWFGFVCADGCMNDTNRTVVVNLSSKDTSHLLKLAKVFNKRVYTYRYYNRFHKKYYNSSILVLANHRIWDALILKGVYPRKTYCDMDCVLRRVPSHLLNHFVRGYFDGDGSVNDTDIKDGKNYCFSLSGPEKFLRQLRGVLIEVLGLSETELESHENMGVIRWSGREQIKLIGEWMYSEASVFMERKKSKYEKMCSEKTRRGYSGYRGVSWHRNNLKWLTSISNGKKRINLGYYHDVIDAAKAYDDAVIRLHKPLYKLNFARG